MKQDRWFSEHIRYGAELGYVMLQLPPILLPAFSYEGINYEPKNELHCSLFCTRKLAEEFADLTAANDKLASFAEGYINDHKLSFDGFTQNVYVCEEEDAKSIIVGVKITGVEALFLAFKREFPELNNLASPALHVTLYKYNHRYGIGIQNEEQLQKLCRPIPINVLPQSISEKL